MSVLTTTTKHAVHDEIEAQIRSIEAKFETLRSRAESAKAGAELKAIVALAAKKQELGHKLDELMKVGDEKWEHRKTELESLIKSIDQSLKDVEARIKTH